MENKPQNQKALELTTQELEEVSGGIYDPNRDKPADGFYDITQSEPMPVEPGNGIGNSLPGSVDQKLKGYLDQYGYPQTYNKD